MTATAVTAAASLCHRGNQGDGRASEQNQCRLIAVDKHLPHVSLKSGNLLPSFIPTSLLSAFEPLSAMLTSWQRMSRKG